MRVLQLHNLYREPGGEDKVVADEARALAKHGHEVRLWSVDNKDLSGAWSTLKTAWQAPYSRAARDQVAGEIAAFAPDIVHVHNFFPLLTPSVYDACRDRSVAVVQTLHNYRTICAGALLMRDGAPCEDCIGASPYQGALHGCYRNSRVASLAVSRMIAIHLKRGTWHTHVDRFIAFTDFAKAKFVAGGLPADKIAVKPNFVDAPASAAQSGSGNAALYVGRLSAEKGIATLLAAWRDLDVPLRLAGDGPLRDWARDTAPLSVTLLGHLSPEALAQERHAAAFCVMPTEWYEPFGLVTVEAFASSRPVIASRRGANTELVEDGVTGLHFTPGDSHDLADKVRWASAHPEDMRRMGENARRVYEEKYTPDIGIEKLIAVYEAAIANRRI
ncbi:MAG: glycosyltransferase family 4 protein [Alphaproteobacteria bacterium]|nr:glycosyltransferase family 4 protein [Alphaproteobacteria bacterium]